MHSFEVHSNESVCRKKVRLGLEQVIGKVAAVPLMTMTKWSFHVWIYFSTMLQRWYYGSANW